MYKKCRFYLFCFLDYQRNYYEVQINLNEVYRVLFDYDTSSSSFIDKENKGNTKQFFVFLLQNSKVQA